MTSRKRNVSHLPNRVLASPIAFFSLLFLLTARPSAAASPFHARVGAQSWVTGHGLLARVSMNEQPVITLRAPAGGLNAAQRAAGVKRRLAALVDAGLRPADIAVVPVTGGQWELVGKGRAILLTTSREAAMQRQSTRQMALSWARNIKARLTDAPLTLSAHQIVVPFGQTRVISVGGLARPADITLSGGDSRIAHAVYEPRPRKLLLLGTGAGQAQFMLHAGEFTLPLTVYGKRFAANLQPRVVVRVTGTPLAPATLVEKALFLGLKQAMTAEPNAQIRLLHAPLRVGPLPPGASATRRLPLHVAGPNLLPVEAAPLVTVVNQPLRPAPATALFYSNNPEQVRGSRTLFRGSLSSFQTVRLDYHHQNRGALPLIFRADVVNASDQRVAVHLIGGVAEPERDTVQIGRRAGAAFLHALDGGIGLVLNVPPHTRVPLVVQQFAPGLTVSGILQVQQIIGSSQALWLEVATEGDSQALAASPARLALTAAVTDSPAAPEGSEPLGASSSAVFGPPRVSLRGVYAVGGQWEHLRLGDGDALHSSDGTQTLWGNYGVSYFVTVRLTNPTRAARVIGLYFVPEAGAAAGVFQITGAPLLQFAPLLPPEEKELTRVRLLPGQSSIVHLRTILLNGSSYPASVVIHSL